MMYICEDCYKWFNKPTEKIFHDGIITRVSKHCPHCNSKFVIENIKKYKYKGDMI